MHSQPPTREQIKLTPSFNPEDKCIDLEVTVDKGGWIIKSVIASNEAIFEGGLHVEYPFKSTNKIKIRVSKDKNTEETVSLRVLIGQGQNSSIFLVHEETFSLHRYAFFMMQEDCDLPLKE